MTDYLAIARECGAHDTQPFGTTDKTLRRVSMLESELSAFAERVRQDERERCAAKCDERAAAIRKANTYRGRVSQAAGYAADQVEFAASVLRAAMAQQVQERAE